MAAHRFLSVIDFDILCRHYFDSISLKMELTAKFIVLICCHLNHFFDKEGTIPYVPSFNTICPFILSIFFFCFLSENF